MNALAFIILLLAQATATPSPLPPCAYRLWPDCSSGIALGAYILLGNDDGSIGIYQNQQGGAEVGILWPNGGTPIVLPTPTVTITPTQTPSPTPTPIATSFKINATDTAVCLPANVTASCAPPVKARKICRCG